MNKHCYRVIFSHVVNCLVVVSELAKTAVKAVSSAVGSLSCLSLWQSLPMCCLRPLTFICLTVLGAVYLPAASAAQPPEIRADKTAAGNNQATILRTANGLPQVNIQAPSAGGVSRNVYTQFDVGERGAILNNSRKVAGSQLAGWVQANPNLMRGEAKVILNEVNSANPSQLKGYLEVAGKKADVIIANPSGLHCDGCGVINAGRTTLTTGRVELEHGVVKGFEVRGGEVEVGPKGMDGSRSDYTDIIAGRVKLGGGVWAKELKVTAGRNRVDGRNEQVVYVGSKGKAVEHDEEFPKGYAIDVSELGGMYAGKIQLLATETGVGVHNAGQIGASAGDVRIDAQGKIVNRGYVGASQGCDSGQPG